MKSNLKKIVLGAVLTTSFALACGLGLGSCSNEETESITLENFKNEEQTVLLDDAFVLPSDTVKDTNGNAYTVAYSVATESGQKVEPIDDVVWIKRMETHYVHCQVETEDKKTYTRTLTLTVKDEGAPEITFGEIFDGFEGETYLLPSLTVKDSSGENIAPDLKIYRLNGDEKGAEVSRDEQSFVPNTAGYYLLEATAKDGSGNTATETEVIRIRPQTAKTTILSFDSPSDVSSVQYKTTKQSSLLSKNWLPEFAGEKNVVQVSFYGDIWAPHFTYSPMQNLSSASATVFDEYDYAILRMYIVKTEEFTNVWDSIKINNDAKTGAVEYNKWVDYKFPLSALTDAQALGTAKFFEASGAGKIVDGEGAEIYQKGAFYVAGIWAVNEATVSVKAVDNSDTVEISAQDGNGENIPLTNATVRVVAPDGTVKTVADGRFKPTLQGRYTVYVQGDGYWGKTSGDPTEILSFDHERDVSNYVKKENTTQWLSEYQGETGVMKVTYTAGTRWSPAFTINVPMQNIHAIENYTHVVVRMYVVRSETVKNVWNTVYMQTTSNPSSVSFEANTWVDYKFTVAQLQDDGKNVGKIKVCGDAGNDITYTDYVEDAPERTGEFYVAGIFLVNEA